MNIRRGSSEDAKSCQTVMWASVTDFAARRGMPLEGTAEVWWASGGAMQSLLAKHAAEWWVAEDGGEIIGYARSIEREGLLELTEFFVVPGKQARGVGKALLDRAFPVTRGEVRSIIATTDSRALARYYAADTSAQFPMFTLVGAPKHAEHAVAARVIDVGRDGAFVAAIERETLGFARGDDELRFLLEEREGWIYSRGDAPIAFGFVGARGSGPIATLDPQDMPDVLSHVESRAAALGVVELELQLPGPNERGVRHLLHRGFHIDPWVNLLMSNRAFGRFDRVVPFGPPVFL